MSKIKMDIDKLKQIGEDLQSFARNYNFVINSLYTKVSNISKDGAWVSDQSDASVNLFITVALKDKANLLNLATTIDSFGSKIIDYTNSMSTIADNSYLGGKYGNSDD